MCPTRIFVHTAQIFLLWIPALLRAPIDVVLRIIHDVQNFGAAEEPYIASLYTPSPSLPIHLNVTKKLCHYDTTWNPVEWQPTTHDLQQLRRSSRWLPRPYDWTSLMTSLLDGETPPTRVRPHHGILLWYLLPSPFSGVYHPTLTPLLLPQPLLNLIFLWWSWLCPACMPASTYRNLQKTHEIK